MTKELTMRFLQSLVRQSVWIAMVAVSFAAHAQETYPNKPIKVVVPYPPGGGGDTLARLMLGRVAQELGQPVVIENLPGAGGNVGSSAAARAKPDGYTLLYGTNNTLAINRTLYKDPGFDVQKDLAPVSRLTQMGMLFVVKSDSKATTLKEAISMLKSAPDKFTFASSGNGTSSHLASEILKSQVQYSAVHVPYRGGAAALTALAGGEVDMMIEVMPSTVPLVKGGRLRALAATTPARTSTLPDVPTFVELGFPDFTVAAWDALWFQLERQYLSSLSLMARCARHSPIRNCKSSCRLAAPRFRRPARRRLQRSCRRRSSVGAQPFANLAR